MKKVLVILDHEFPADIRVENEIEILNDMGICVHLLVYTMVDKQPYEKVNDYFYIHRKPISKFLYKSSVAVLKFPFYFNFWLKFVREILVKEKFDAIHVNDLPLSKIALKAGAEYKIPVILDLHENWPFLVNDAKHTNTLLGKFLSSHQQWLAYEREMTKKADYIITVVDEMKKRVEKLGVSSEKIIVYQNVPNLKSLDHQLVKKTTKDFILFYAGGITEARGLQVVLKGIQLLDNAIPNLTFRILGNGVYLPNLKELAKVYNIEKYLDFKGNVPQAEVMNSLTAANVCVIPHLKSVQNDNSSPNKIFQYMLSKTAILSSNCNSLERLLDETSAGLNYKDIDAEDFAQKLLWLYNNPKETVRYGENGYKAVLEKYNTDFESSSVRNLYSKI
jgi:glycosyltransferase involved in cell wall biosynthesis